MSREVLETLRELVQLPSVNPMGRELSADVAYEGRVTDYLQQRFQQMGLPWHRQTVAPGRDNILARLDGDPSWEQGGSLLMLQAHQDTVPTEGMTISPWAAELRDGRVYGRGSCDVKGALACMLTALSHLAARRPARRPTVLLACTVDEEYGFSGARRMVQLWQSPGGFVPRRPDAAVVAEPTLLDVVVAHKGTARWQIHTQGRAAHSSQPEAGSNAIYKMAPVLAALERYARTEVTGLADHALLGQPTLSVGRIQGGISVNVVPDRCRIELDRRLVPGEEPRAAWQHVVDFLTDELPELPLVHEEPYQSMPGLDGQQNQELAERLGRVARACGARGRPIGVPYGTDAPAFAQTGVPTVVCGPGDIAQAHTVDEWIALEQLHAGTEFYYRLATEWDGAD